MSRSLAQRLKLQLADMGASSTPGDPFDDGYQEAIGEIEDWLSDQPETQEEES